MRRDPQVIPLHGRSSQGGARAGAPSAGSPPAAARAPLAPEAVPVYSLTDHESEAYAQVDEAVDAADVSVEETLRWPWPSLDALTGPMPRGELWFLAALSGMGKTAFLMTLTDVLVAGGWRVHYFGLETRPSKLRVHLACRRLARTVDWFNVHPQDAINGLLRARAEGGDPHAIACRQLLAEEFARQASPDHAEFERLRFVPGALLSEATLYKATQQAVDAEADLVIVDHIDHFDPEQGMPEVTASRRLSRACLTNAQDSGVNHLVATQCNAAAMADGHLGVYAPPLINHVWFGQTKRQVADGMLGLSKKLVPPPSPTGDAKADKAARAEYAHLKERARHDATALERLIVPNTMCVTLMKDRGYGRERASVDLRVHHGRVIEEGAPPVMARAESADRHGISTRSRGSAAAPRLAPPAARGPAADYRAASAGERGEDLATDGDLRGAA